VGTIAAALLIWLTFTARNLRKNPPNPGLALFFTSTLYLFVYLAAIVFSLFFFDASTPFHDRILAPVYISLLTVFAVFGADLWRKAKLPLRILLVILTLCAASVSVAN